MQRGLGQRGIPTGGPSVVRSRFAALAASIITHAIALVWITGHTLAMPLAPPRATGAPAPVPAAAEPPPLRVELIELEPPPAPPAPVAPAAMPRPAPPRPLAPRPQVARTRVRVPPSATASPPSTVPEIASAPAPITAPITAPGPAPAAAGDAAVSAGLRGSGGPDAPSGSSGTGATRLLERFPGVDMRMTETSIDQFLAHEAPLGPSRPEINAAAHALDARLAELDDKLTNPAWRAIASPQQVAGAELDRESLRRERDDLTMKPLGGDRYRNDQEAFTIDVARDGTVAIHDKPPIRFEGLALRFDVTDMIMRARGEDPYARSKLRFLDRTRDERAELGRRHRAKQLSRSPELMRASIDQLWANTRDPAARREGLFELWDDCADTGDAELVGGAGAARRVVIGEIRARLRGADAYTPDELARFNARRTSTARFEPYDDPADPAP